MAKPNNNKNHVFVNTDFVVIYYCSTRKQLNQLFSFALNLLTVRIIIVCSNLLISSFTKGKKINVVYGIGKVVVRLCNVTAVC